MLCKTCFHLKGFLTNGLPQCGYPITYPPTIEGDYLNGKVFPEWFGCNQYKEKK